MLRFLIVFFFISASIFVQAQNSYIIQDSGVDSLIMLHKQINCTDSLVPGYRVQIFFESGNYSKNLAMQTAENFQESFPDIRYYLSFSEPYYRIRVGDFRTLIEAKGFLMSIISQYPAAFEVKDRIYFPPLAN